MSCANIQTSVPGVGSSGGCCSNCGSTAGCGCAKKADFITADGWRYYNDQRLFGLVDGVNVEFSLANAPVEGTLTLFINGGRRLERYLDFDYYDNKITFTFALMPATGILREDVVIASYFAEKLCH